MDSDDKDSKEQNLQLAGEGSSKVSPILHPYALPKFDFDDGHLRFDTLVENEVFLGITSQEDNQWIEEYSRGTSAIQFSSSAAELRQKNVWSEATSSESVEMLLKSVGHEERVVEETTEEAVAYDRPDNLTNVMDPNLKQCDGADNDVNTYDAPVRDEFQENFVGSKASSNYEQSHAASSPQFQETPVSDGKLDSVVLGDKYSLSVGEKKVYKISDDVNQEPISLANEPHVNDSQEDPSVSKIECENKGSSLHSIEESQEIPQEVPESCVKNVDGPSKNFDNCEPEHVNKSEENISENPADSGTIVETYTYSMEKLSVVSNVGPMENPLVESIRVDDKPTGSSPLKSCDMQKTVSAEHSLDRKSEISSSLISPKIHQELNDNVHEGSPAVSPKSDVNIKRPAIEDANTQSDIPDSPKSNVGSQKFQEEENVASDGQQVIFDASMVSLGNNQLESSEGGDVNNVGKTSIAAGSSAEMPAEDILIKDEAAENHAPEVHTVDSKEEYQSSPAKISSLVQVDDEIQSSEPDAISMDQDVTINERGDARLPLDYRDTDMDVVGALDSQKNVEEPSSSADGCKGVIVMDEGSGPNTAVLPDAGTAVEPNQISSDDTSDDVHLPSEVDTTANIVTEDQPISPILGVSALHDGNEEKAVAFSSEESSQKGTQKVDIMVDCTMDGQLSVVEKDAAGPEGAEKAVHELDDRCDPSVKNCNASPSEETTEDNPVDLKCSKASETIRLPCESSAEGGNDAEAGGLLDPKDSITGDGVEPLNLAVNVPDEQQDSVNIAGPSEPDANHVEHNGVGSASLDKPQTLSSSDTKSIELSQNASDKHEVPKDTKHVDAPLSKVSNEREGLKSVSSSGATKEEKSFTFEVTASAGLGQTGIQNLSLSKNTKLSSVTSSGSPLVPNKLHEDLVIQQTPSSAAIEAGPNGNSERKRRRKSAGMETAKKSNNLKESTPRRRSGKVEKSPALLNPPAIGHVTSGEKLKPNENVEGSNPKPGDISPIPTSNLPDLNNSVSMVQPSFTDTQQVQLRAQILVYGSLISGMPPEESHMVAAFGLPDGGRRAWEAAWHACVKRVHGRKSQVKNPDTPMPSRSDAGTKDPDQGTKVGSVQNKFLSPLTPRPSNVGISSNIVTPMIPISSPLWNISTPGDGLQANAMPRNALLDYRPTVSPLHPYQTPRVPNLAVRNPSWPSQSPYPPQWVASSPVTAFGARLSALPITDAVKLTTVKESSAPGVSVIPVNHTPAPTVSSGLSSLSNMKKTAVTVSSGQPSSDTKSRKRKKVAASSVVSEISVPSQPQVAPVAHLPWAPHTEGHNQISFLAQNQTITGTAPVVSSHPPTSAGLLTPVSIVSKSNPSSSLLALSPASTHVSTKSSDQNVEKIATREEIVSKIEESKLQAADAAVHAAAAVSHCQGVWSQLEKQKSSGLVSDDEAKLASSAASIAAAASVAKVAAAAAKIASNVAEQARLMADEVFLSSRTESYANIDPNFDKATPASILKSANRSDDSTSIISAAREAARRRIEAASAASKHAENLDAIVKAAELAAEAVSQAGKIVAMGKPLPVKELIEAGPEGYWKMTRSSNQPEFSDKQNVEAAVSDKDLQTSKHGLPLQEGFRDMSKNQVVVDGVSGSTTSNENGRDAERAREGFELSKTVGVFSEPEFGSVDASNVEQKMPPESTSGTLEEDRIKEGCLVEVYKNGNQKIGAWFAANVLTLKDGKAFVCYTEIQSDEGSEQLKEWVPLKVEGIEAPKIRIAHPMTKLQFEGTRKRSRKAFSDYVWCSGDMVDVWVQDRWREAVVMDRTNKDATYLNVRISGEVTTSRVRSWHVRPTLIWKDGKWIEWSDSKGFRSSEGDTPQEKRLKVGKPVVDVNKKDMSSINVDLIDSAKPQQSTILPVFVHGSSFNVGKSSKDDNKLENARRTMRTGPQKERSRVVFGVPKPGKKQKFMDVSKHYVAEGTIKNNPPNDSAKLPSSSIPQAPGLTGLRHNLKTEAKEKQVAEANSKVLKTRKPPVPSLRTLAQKDKPKPSKPTSHDAVMSSKTVKDSVAVDENVSPPKTMEDPSASRLPSDAQKGRLTSKVISQRLNRGKAAAGGGKAAKVEEKETSASESEPRRSNRRIQPTSRLLEGLQSSISVSKTPTSSHASQRSHNKVMSKGNG